MSETREQVIASLRAILAGLAASLGHDSGHLTETDIIPDSGVVDSAGLIEFVVLADDKYGLAIEAEDMTVDRLGTLGAFADFVLSRRGRVEAAE